MSSTGVRCVVVVGGGVAGVSTVAALRSGGYDGELTLIDAGEFPYDRPPLSKDYLAGTRAVADLHLQTAAWFDEQAVRLITNTSVTALRPSQGAVELSAGAALPADRVVLATGGHAAQPPLPGADGHLVHTLRTTEDADRLRSVLVPGTRLLVVGAGLIGAEVASTAVDLGCEVALVDPVAPPLAPAVGAEVAEWLHDQHAVRGVRTVCAGVESLQVVGAAVLARLTGSAAPELFDAVVLGVGMVPETSLAAAAGLDIDRGVLVDLDQHTSNPAVLAVGDSTRLRRDGVPQPRSEHWEAARDGGARAAASLVGSTRPEPRAPWFWTDRHRRHVEVVGHMGPAPTTVLRGVLGGPSFAVFGMAGDLVTAAVSVDDPTSARAARRMVDRRVRVDPARLADPSSDLRRLLRG